MRILWDAEELNQDGMIIEEINNIEFCKCWSREDAGKEKPTVIQMLINNNYIASYDLETDEEYKKAIENIKEVKNKLLIKGYCKASDFKGLTWD